MREMARVVLPGPVFDFADGGAEDEATLRANEAAFDTVEFLPRPLQGAAARDLSVSLFDRRLALPVIFGPTGLAGLFWPKGETAAARAAAAAGTAFCLSHGSVCTLEELAETGAAPRWMQIFIYKDRSFTHELAERAAVAGYEALVLTIDNQLLGNRERDLRNGFSIPPRLRLSALPSLALRLPWLMRMAPELRRITFGNYVRPDEPADPASIAGRMASLLDPAMSWADVADLRKRWPGPLVLKGVLHPEEAARAVDAGVDGLIVSNHGGRQLDGAAASFRALPAVVDRVGGRIPVMLDGGIRRGADVVKALALGARCCLIGRPMLWGLSIAGEAGAAHVLDIFRREIDRVMGLLGASRVEELGPHILAPRDVFGTAFHPSHAAPPAGVVTSGKDQSP
jgi:isopentenyl diphosphate isomerase/L-lactate dehydrogenase-like FMN-dependent dehydrogenase